VTRRMHDQEVRVDEDLVGRLLAGQMPAFADLALTPIEPWGTDNAIWRLGDELVVRLPRIHWATGQIDLEAEWLPRLAPHLPIAVPEPVAIGEPGEGYPYRWAVHRWIPGEGAALGIVAAPVPFALELADAVRGLRAVPTVGAPPARNRARPLQQYDKATRGAIDRASHLIDAAAATAVWEEALAAPPHPGPPVWVQGDLEGNCLVRDGRLCGIVDWGSACTGDPAVDVQVVWSPLFTDDSRRAFLDALGVDDATVARSRGAAINQACAALPYYLDTYPLIVERSWHKLSMLGVSPRSDVIPTGALRMVLARAEDVDTVVGLLSDAARWMDEHGIDQWPSPFPEAVVARTVERGETYLAFVGDRGVGSIAVSDDDPNVWGPQPPDALYVHRLVVARAATGRAIGARLLDWATEQAVERGRAWLRLDCGAENGRLRGYYERLGFRHVGDTTLDLPAAGSGPGTWRGSLYQRPVAGA
jgi:aminoglycoside phosphotransferase (APT) family kinase protein/GNAT superfamily N-acetyltransferase